MLKRRSTSSAPAIALIVLSPVFAYIALRIRLDSDGPVFFRQTRLGTNMKEFTALKFRTMKVGTDQAVHQDGDQADRCPPRADAPRTAACTSSSAPML